MFAAVQIFFLVETAHFIINSYIIQLMLQQIKQKEEKIGVTAVLK